MSKLLMPYGSMRNNRLIAKVGNGGGGKSDGLRLYPYGSDRNSRLVVKMGVGGKTGEAAKAAPTRQRVVRLNRQG